MKFQAFLVFIKFAKSPEWNFYVILCPPLPNAKRISFYKGRKGDGSLCPSVMQEPNAEGSLCANKAAKQTPFVIPFIAETGMELKVFKTNNRPFVKGTLGDRSQKTSDTRKSVNWKSSLHFPTNISFPSLGSSFHIHKKTRSRDFVIHISLLTLPYTAILPSGGKIREPELL